MPTGVNLMDSIRLRAFEMNMSMSELDEACRSGHLFQHWSINRRMAMKHILKAIEVLDGEVAVEWSSLEDGGAPAMPAPLPLLPPAFDSGSTRCDRPALAAVALH